jgi:CheY-like chemotaxis protein
MPDEPARVLVVEDDPELRLVLDALLSMTGYQVETAADGRAALACIHRRRPDVLLLDVRLPELDGWQLTAALRAEGLRIPTLFMSGALPPPPADLAGGVALYLQKPFDVETLLRCVAALSRVTAPTTDTADAAARWWESPGPVQPRAAGGDQGAR